MKRQHGFTILELMIVVSIIAIIASMALPSLLNARKGANEAAAVSTLRSLTSVMEQYKTRFGRYPTLWDHLSENGYLDGFGGEVNPMVSGAPNAGGKSGYTYLLSSLAGIPWRVLVMPNDPGVTGDRYFYADSSGVIRFSTVGMAGHTSTPLD